MANEPGDNGTGVIDERFCQALQLFKNVATYAHLDLIAHRLSPK